VANKGEKTGVPVSGQGIDAKERVTVVVDADIEASELLRLEAEGRTDFVFDPKSMPEFDDEIVAEFGHDLKRQYFVALGALKRDRDERAIKSNHAKKPPQLWVNDPFDQVAVRTEKLVADRDKSHPGWHATWVRNDQIEEFKEVGYKEVRKAKEGEKVGEETDEWIKINESDKITIYLMEIPNEVHQRILKAASYRSQVRYSGDAENSYRQFIEGVNRDIGARREVVTPVVERSEGEEVVERG
jgi:hypothetical protein